MKPDPFWRGDCSAARPGLWLGESEVRELLPLPDAIQIIERTHLHLAEGSADVAPRSHLSWDGGTLHAVGGLLSPEDAVGAKVWAYTPDGSQPLLALFSARSGMLNGLMEARLLGRLRTAATTGVATAVLARRGASRLAIIGTGRQALPQVQAIHAVRSLQTVAVFGRDAKRRAAFVEVVGEATGLKVTEHSSIPDAVGDADIVVTITRAREPVLSAQWLKAGVHVNGVGAIVARARELHVDVVARAGAVVVDFLPQARTDCGELIAAERAGLFSWEQATQLSEVLHGRSPGRTGRDEVTLFRGLGVGLADVALGAEALRRARASGIGQRLPRSG